MIDGLNSQLSGRKRKLDETEHSGHTHQTMPLDPTRPLAQEASYGSAIPLGQPSPVNVESTPASSLGKESPHSPRTVRVHAVRALSSSAPAPSAFPGISRALPIAGVGDGDLMKEGVLSVAAGFYRLRDSPLIAPSPAVTPDQPIPFTAPPPPKRKRGDAFDETKSEAALALQDAYSQLKTISDIVTLSASTADTAAAEVLSVDRCRRVKIFVEIIANILRMRVAPGLGVTL